jgi:hypothetical protein
MNKREKLLKGTVIAIAGVLLQACVSAPKTPMLATDGTAKSVLTEPKENEKLYPVVLSISFNTDATYDSVLLSSMTEKPFLSGKDKTYKLNLINRGEALSTFIYSGKLPVGEYRLAQLSQSVDTTTHYINIADQNADQLGNFQVKEDYTSDLGRVIVTHANDAFFIVRAQDFSSNRDIIRQLPDNYEKAIYSTNRSAGWNQPVGSFELAIQSYAKKSPSGIRCIQEKKDGSLLAASKMGAVLYFPSQNSAEKAAVFSSGSVYGFNCLTQKDEKDFDFLAYGEMGALFKHVKNSNILTPVDTGDLPLGEILSVVGNSLEGWFITVKKGKQAAIYRSNVLDKGKWEVFADFPKLETLVLGQIVPGVWVWEDAQGFSYIDTNGTISRYVYASKLTKKNSIPDKGTQIMQFTNNPDGSIGILTTSKAGLAGAFAKQYFSKDYGENWSKFNSAYHVNARAPQASAQGTLYIVAGHAFSPTGMSVSEDNGKTWQKRQVATNSSLTVLDSGRIISMPVFSRNSNVFISDDKGKDWNLLYTTFSKKLLEYQSVK